MNAVGADLSRYNVFFNPDAATSPIDFVFQKATQGITYIDTSYEEIWRGVQKVGIRGAYHYQSSGFSWEAQAKHFLEVANRHDYHIYSLDMEEYGNDYTDTFFIDAKRIIDYWRANSDKKVVLYTNSSSYNSMYHALVRAYGSPAKTWMDELPLWLASPSSAGSPILPPNRLTWQFHQYSWIGDPTRWGTGGTRVDENVFNGDVNQLNQWLGITGSSGGEGEIMTQRYKVTRPNGCNIRTDHNTSSQIVGVLPVDTEFDVTEHYVPTSPLQEDWGKTVNNTWVALTYAAQPRVVLLPPPPTGVVKTHDIEVWSDGSLKIDGNPYP